MTTPLEIEDLKAGYEDSSPVLSGLNLTLEPGTITGLLGRNGSGKSTLMNVATGLKRCLSGRVRLFGEDAWDSPAETRKRIGYVAQQSDNFSWLTVDQAIEYNSSFYPAWDHELVDGLKAQWRLGGRKVSQLSVGENQRLGILLAIGHRPDLLVLDEPVAALDPGARREFLGTLIGLNLDDGQTALLSSHITSDIERVCTHVAILNEGRIVCHAVLDDLKDRVRMVDAHQVSLPLDKTIARIGDRAWVWDAEQSMPQAVVGDVELEELYLALTSPVEVAA